MSFRTKLVNKKDYKFHMVTLINKDYKFWIKLLKSHCAKACTKLEPVLKSTDSAYTERYMGLPNITDNYKGYEESDVSKWAESLRDKMLYLIHGTADDNVHFQQSMALVKALSAKGIIFKQQVYPDEKHTLMGVKYHLYKSMVSHLESCFQKLIPRDLKSGLRNGGMLEPTAT